MRSSTKNQLLEVRSLQPITLIQRLKARRKAWLRVHLWLGLTLGMLLSIYGITGSILVFHAEIDEWLHPELLVIDKPANAQYRPLGEIFAAGKAAMPPEAKHTFATYPRNACGAFQLNFSVPSSDGEEKWLVGVNPYTAQATGNQLLKRSSDWLPSNFINFIFELHYDLLLPPAIGDLLVGISGALLIISTLTGLIVWWPLTGKWRQALTIKAGAGKVRVNYDLHKISGFYTTLVMVPVLFSGVYMVLPHNVVPVLEVFSPVTYRYWFQSTPPAENAPAIGMDQAVTIALRQYPDGHPHWIYGAPNPAQTYTVCQDGVDAPGSILQRRCTVIDRYTGKILDLDDPSLPTATAGEIFTHWQWPLHSGQAFGMTGRILVFITGLACPVLFVTGVIRWLQKRRGGRRAAK
ncbi:PepSY-associated TM helix domain-containing protein [Methylomonas koyamae]|uniref:Peptidase n=1 Tax=Methylomonas koyamae TaxID=702114 RepID=A0AA91I4T2_9GAMM|nr:PepSY-associated TM helix domain-containing protein [Methylomonas koyamae]OAI25044.1 peptidase [Methylomonas koyamae]